MQPPQLYFADRNLKVLHASRRAFETVQNACFNTCQVDQVHPAQVPVAYMAAGNSFGMMSDGVVGALESATQGGNVVKNVQRAIAEHHAGELHVGSCVVVHFADARPGGTSVVFAPTMRAPTDDISATLNAYFSFRAALLAARAHGFRSMVVCCASDAYGKMQPDVVATQMRAAYDSVYGGAGPGFDHKSIVENNRWLSCSVIPPPPPPDRSQPHSHHHPHHLPPVYIRR
jgi:O-acetyl-ADP-ribose deacetylase (regulator of RNase III)